MRISKLSLRNFSKEMIGMGKIVWVNSSCGIKGNDGLDEINRMFADAWSVKLISACATNSMNFGQAYIVLEKK